MGLFEQFPYTNMHELNLDWILDFVKKTKEKTEQIDEAVSKADEYAGDARTSMLSAGIFKNSAEAWAVGERSGEPVEPGDDQYNNHSKYWAGEAADSAADAADLVDHVEDIQQEVRDALAEQDDDIAVLIGRMDAFTQLAEGSTTGDAELMDIRVGANGTVYPTAGDAVRGQVDDLESELNAVADIEHNVSNNLWNIDQNTNGYQLDAGGDPTPNADYTLSDFIEVEALTQYWVGIINNSLVKAPAVQRVCFYDSSQTFLDKTNTTADVGTFTTIADTKYIRMAVYTANFFSGGNDTAMLLKGNAPAGYVPYFAPYASAEVKNSAINYETVNEHINANEDFYLFESINLFDVNNSGLILNDKAINSSGVVYPLSDYSVIKIPVNGIDSKSYYLYGLNTPGTSYIPKSTRIAMYDAYGVCLGLLVNNTTNPAVITSNACKYLYMYYATSDLDNIMVLTDTNGASVSSFLFIPYERKYQLKTQWFGKGWSAYGDSITAISNGNSLVQGWAYYVNKIHGFSEFYGRGIGAQQFAWRTNGGSVAFINADGTYNSRNDSYNYDNYNGAVPAGCTAVRGAFCSWLRITTMFPEAIKDNINLVFVMGGTNGAYDDSSLEWVANDTTDPEWAASDEYATYGGDYNISTFNGGVASTIMKMQAWLPNAIIVLGTPLNGQTNDAGHIKPDAIPDEYQKSKLIEEIGKMFGCPVVDVFGSCGINVLNSPTYITDGTHPYNKSGVMMLGRTVASGLTTIYPKM